MPKLFWKNKGSGRDPESSSSDSSAADAAFIDTHPDVVHVDPEQLDADTRAMYRDARHAAAEEADQEPRATLREIVVSSPFKLGFTVTLGALFALLLGGIFGEISTILMYIVAALFIALGLDPVVRYLARKGMRRGAGISVVFAGFVVIVGGILAIVIPMIANQISLLVTNAPHLVNDIQNQGWYRDINARFGEFIDFNQILKMGQDFASDPSHIASVAGGVWQAGIGIANGLTATLIVLILSLYFLASLPAMKRAFYAVVARSRRARVIDITEQVTRSVGGYVIGMVILAFTNAVLGFIMMTIVGVPFAGLVAVFVFMLALIPLIGSVLATVLVSLVALFNSPITALIAVIYYLIYMQLESYLLTPKVMSRVVSVPGSLVVIGALVGGSVLGLLGALISIPVAAMIIMIVKQVWVPRQELR